MTTRDPFNADVRTVFKKQLPIMQSTAIKLRERLRQWHKKGDEVLKAAEQEPGQDEFKGVYNDWIADLQHVAKCSSELSKLMMKLSKELPLLAQALRAVAQEMQD